MLVKVTVRGNIEQKAYGAAVAEFGKDGGRQERVEQRTQRLMEMREPERTRGACVGGVIEGNKR